MSDLRGCFVIKHKELSGALKLIFFPAIGTSPGVVYITEVARPELRGALIGIGLILANVGEFAWEKNSVWLISFQTFPSSFVIENGT